MHQNNYGNTNPSDYGNPPMAYPQINSIPYGTPHYAQGPPAPQAGPTVITINNNQSSEGRTFCPVCTNMTQSYPKKVIGGGNFLWCLVGFAFVGPFSILAICMDNFNDVEMKCTQCMGTK